MSESLHQAVIELTENPIDVEHSIDIGRMFFTIFDRLTVDELEDLTDRLLGALAGATDRVQVPIVILRGIVRGSMSSHEEAEQERIRAANGGHQVYVMGGKDSEDGDWWFDCWCLGDDPELEPPSRSTREEAMADMLAHMFEHGLTEAAYDPHLMSDET